MGSIKAYSAREPNRGQQTDQLSKNFKPNFLLKKHLSLLTFGCFFKNWIKENKI